MVVSAKKTQMLSMDQIIHYAPIGIGTIDNV